MFALPDRRVSKTKTDATIRAAKARGRKRMIELLHEAGGLVSRDQAMQLLGVSSQELDSRVLIFIRSEDGNSGYPRFQFESERMIDGVGRVLSAMDVESPWMQLSFFFLHLSELGGRQAIEAIRDNEIEPVIRAATHFGQHGAS